MADNSAWEPPAQCTNCVHRRLTGGFVIEAQWTCAALEGEPGRMARVMTLILTKSAERNECVAKDPLPTPEGSYLSQDLLAREPNRASLNHQK